MIHRADIKFVIGQEPTWTDAEIGDAYWKVLEALIFLNNHGVQFHQVCLQEPSKQTMAAGWDKMAWHEVFNDARKQPRPDDGITIYLVLRAENWFRPGMAGGIPSDFIVVDYRAQFEQDWSIFSRVVAHELLHCLGAHDEYTSDGKVSRACIMADLAQRKICKKTLLEIQK